MSIRKVFTQAGFTMIELLVVIAVIGVLAVAVLSSINPIEQINKGRDTRTRSDAAQLVNAIDRYFATQEKYPWNNTNTACGPTACAPALGQATGEAGDPGSVFPHGTNTQVCTPVAASNPGVGMCQLTATSLWLDGLESTAEVKGAFVDRIRAQTTYAIYVYKATNTDSTMYACFRPSSNSFQAEALKNCQSTSIAVNYPAAVMAAACPDGAAGAAYVDGANDELICLP